MQGHGQGDMNYWIKHSVHLSSFSKNTNEYSFKWTVTGSFHWELALAVLFGESVWVELKSHTEIIISPSLVILGTAVHKLQSYRFICHNDALRLRLKRTWGVAFILLLHSGFEVEKEVKWVWLLGNVLSNTFNDAQLWVW